MTTFCNEFAEPGGTGQTGCISHEAGGMIPTIARIFVLPVEREPVGSIALVGIPSGSLRGVAESQPKAGGEQQVIRLLPWRRVAEVIIVEGGLPTQELRELGNQAQADRTAIISRRTTCSDRKTPIR